MNIGAINNDLQVLKKALFIKINYLNSNIII